MKYIPKQIKVIVEPWKYADDRNGRSDLFFRMEVRINDKVVSDQKIESISFFESYFDTIIQAMSERVKEKINELIINRNGKKNEA